MSDKLGKTLFEKLVRDNFRELLGELADSLRKIYNHGRKLRKSFVDSRNIFVFAINYLLTGLLPLYHQILIPFTIINRMQGP